MLNRHLKEMGIQPFLAILISLFGLCVGTYFLFSKMEYASWVIVSICILITSKTSESKRVSHLITIFNLKEFRKIRLLENLTIAFPFLIILIVYVEYTPIPLLLLASFLLSFYKAKKTTSFIIPTPFSKRPFEFTSGFRKQLITFIGIYALFGISIAVSNFNLGIFCLIAIYLTCFSFYSEPEDKLFVWIFNQSPKKFIFDKVKTSLRYSFLMTLPLIVSLLIICPHQYLVISTFSALGLLSIVTMVIAKYSSFPFKMNVPKGIIFSLGVCLPPLLLAIIPYFYSQARTNLKEIL